MKERKAPNCEWTGKPLLDCQDRFIVVGDTYLSEYTGLEHGVKECLDCEMRQFFTREPEES